MSQIEEFARHHLFNMVQFHPHVMKLLNSLHILHFIISNYYFLISFIKFHSFVLIITHLHLYSFTLHSLYLINFVESKWNLCWEFNFIMEKNFLNFQLQ